MRTRDRRASWIAIGMAAAALAWWSTSPAAGSRPAGAATFSGSCQFSGPVRFRPGLSTAPRTVVQSVKAPGTCSGSFRDRHGFTHKLSGARAVYSETSSGGNVSCAAGTPTGRGSLRFRWGSLRFAFAERRVAAVVAATATGASGGSATGYAAPSASESPLSAVQRCAGTGIREVRVDVHLVTTPEISG